MATATLTRDQLSDAGRQVVELVEKLGFKWTARYDYPTPDPLDPADPELKRLQTRTQERFYAPAGKVAEIRQALARGEKLPPIVVTEDGWIVDGNTRITAAQRNKQATMEAVIVDMKYEGAKDSEMQRLWGLGAAFNARHGNKIDRQALERAVMQMGENPVYTATRIASLIGVTEASVRNILAERDARMRAANVGLHVNGSVNATKLRKLGRVSEYLNDEPFKELFSLIEDTGLSVEEIQDVVTRARATKSDEGALGVIAAERKARKDQIAEYKASNKSVPPAAAKLRQRLGFILGFSANPRELLEHNQTLTKEHVDTIERAIAVLQKVVKAQEA